MKLALFQHKRLHMNMKVDDYVLFCLPILICLFLFLAASICGKGPEQMVKKAMQSIMMARSVIYTKTDLTQICNKPAIRLEAVKRLVAANLLQYGNDFWIEPSRTKKELKKTAKRIIREGWLK